MMVLGGLRILERLEDVQFDVFSHRPTLSRLDWLRLIALASEPHPSPTLNVHEPRRVLSEQGSPERLQFLLRLFVSATRTPPCHYRAICLLPRGR